MKNNSILSLLQDTDYHIDPLGRMVIDNAEILDAINGAMKDSSHLEELLVNGGCSNTGC